MKWGTPLFGNVTTLDELHMARKYWTKYDAHMRQACGPGSSQGAGGAWVKIENCLRVASERQSGRRESHTDVTFTYARLGFTGVPRL